MQEDKVVYLVEGKVDVGDLRDFCDGVCLKEFGRPAYDWEIGKELDISDKALRGKLRSRFRKIKDGYYLTIRPQKAVV